MRETWFRGAILAFIGLSLLFAVWWTLRTVPRAIFNRATAKEEKVQDINSLVVQIRELSRLETASMRVMHVSTIEQSYGVVPNTLAGDKITFLAVGDVIAGIDLSRISRDDVSLSGDGTLTLRLPESSILVSRVDNRQSRVLNRDTGWLRKADPNLEGRVRQSAELSIRREAMDKGILQLASNNAEAKLAAFLNTLGFEKVRFERAQVSGGG
jgi:hypothetical protein